MKRFRYPKINRVENVLFCQLSDTIEKCLILSESRFYISLPTKSKHVFLLKHYRQEDCEFYGV